MIISVNDGVFDKSQHPWMIKTLSKLGLESGFLIKQAYQTHIAIIIIYVQM